MCGYSSSWSIYSTPEEGQIRNSAHSEVMPYLQHWTGLAGPLSPAEDENLFAEMLSSTSKPTNHGKLDVDAPCSDWNGIQKAEISKHLDHHVCYDY